MRALLVLGVCIGLAATASAHTYSEHGNITTFYPDVADAGLFPLIEGLAPGAIPNGLFYYVIHGVGGGESYSVIADDGQEAFVIGTARECPGPDTFDPTNPDWWMNDFWVYCRNVPDFFVWFACNGTRGGSSGVTPCGGDVLIGVFFGDVGEGFSWSESW